MGRTTSRKSEKQGVATHSGVAISKSGTFKEVGISGGRFGLAAFSVAGRKPVKSDTVHDEIVALVAHTFRGQAGAAQRFLTSPHMLLDGRTPKSLMAESPSGAQQVLQLVQRAIAGVAV